MSCRLTRRRRPGGEEPARRTIGGCHVVEVVRLRSDGLVVGGCLAMFLGIPASCMVAEVWTRPVWQTEEASGSPRGGRGCDWRRQRVMVRSLLAAAAGGGGMAFAFSNGFLPGKQTLWASFVTFFGVCPVDIALPGHRQEKESTGDFGSLRGRWLVSG